MKLTITSANKIDKPLKGFGFAFIDEEDKKLKIKKHDSIIEFNNDLSDIQLLDLTDYTAFEVFAHDYDIPVGECEELGGYVNYSLPACMAHEFTIRTDHSPENQNVIVDWGDGAIIKLSDVTPVSDSVYDYKISHTYTSTGKYIVKIFGNKYYALKHAQENNKQYNNILCRVLSEDLPIASHLTNFSSFCLGANHIINLNITNTNFIKQCANIATMCGYCKNLISAVGFPIRNKKNISYGYLFTYCYSLETTDLQIMPALDGGGIGYIFRACKKLKTSPEYILKYFLPAPGSTYNVTGLFYQCEVLTGTVPANKLWNNKQVTWTGTATCFGECSDEIRDQVPESWGGIASDDIIEKSWEEKYNDLLARVEALESK